MNSLISGPAWVEPPHSSIAGALSMVAGSDAVWLTFHGGSGSQSLTFAEAFSLAGRWARSMREGGVKPGDRVAILQPNGPGFVGAFLGAQLAGATAVPLPWPVVAAAGLRNHAALLALVRTADAAAISAPADFEAAGGFGLPVVSAPAPAADACSADLDPVQAAFIQFTSGTTDAPRGAVISHRAAVSSAWAMGLALGLDARDVGVSWLPLFHDMGLVGVLLCSLIFRFQIHLMSPGEFLLRPWRWLELLAQTRATLTVAPNFGYELAVRRAGPAKDLDLSRLRHALDGSEPVHRATLDGFERRFALPQGTVRPVYGLAENTLGVCFGDGAAADLIWERRAVPSVGRPLPGTFVSIRLEDGAVAPEGAVGEIAVRGPGLMTGYFRDPAATEAALRGGWLYTGDLGVIEGGRLHVTGREKDLVIRNGRKFHPYDIERIVAVAVDAPPSGVVAFSIPNSASGTEDLVVVAELRRRTDEAALLRLVRGRLLEELGIRPERLRLVGPGALPRTTSGKLRRRACALKFGAPDPAPAPAVPRSCE